MINTFENSLVDSSTMRIDRTMADPKFDSFVPGQRVEITAGILMGLVGTVVGEREGELLLHVPDCSPALYVAVKPQAVSQLRVSE
jgi:hypothetical protein